MGWRGSGDGVVAGAAKGVAAEDAFEGEPAAPERAVFLDGFHGVLGAGGGEAADGGCEWGDAVAIEGDEGEHRFGNEVFHSVQQASHGSGMKVFLN